MYCRNCGKKIEEVSNFCIYCGHAVDGIIHKKQTVPRVWSVFAKLSKIFGIVCISTCWIPFFGLSMLSLSVPGIVFGALGRKGSADKTVGSNSIIGLILSIISTVLAFVFYILFIVVMMYLSNF